MALTTTGIGNTVDGAFTAASGFSAADLALTILTLVFVTLYVWAAWGMIGSFLNFTSGKSSAAGFGVAIGLIMAVLLIVMGLLA